MHGSLPSKEITIGESRAELKSKNDATRISPAPAQYEMKSHSHLTGQ
jgi:hypothetical protein